MSRFRMSSRVQDLEPYVPAPYTYQIKLDANESFVSLSPELRSRLQALMKDFPFNRYPDPSAQGVCRSYADYLGVPEENVVAGNGSDELLGVVLGGFFEKGDRILISSPDFSMYTFYSHMAGLELIDMPKNDSMKMDLDLASDIIREKGIRAVIFSNPCNPTGSVLQASELRRFVAQTDALVLLDEAYMDFSDQSIAADAPGTDNLLVFRTCSKAFGLAGLRLGFAVGPRYLIDDIFKSKSPFNVNMLTQSIAEIVLSDKEFISSSVRRVIESRDSLQKQLQDLAGEKTFQVYETAANFVLIETEQAEAVYRYLLEFRICIRYLGGRLLRITAGTDEENTAVIRGLREYFRRLI